jgi:hypothetical protein
MKTTKEIAGFACIVIAGLTVLLWADLLPSGSAVRMIRDGRLQDLRRFWPFALFAVSLFGIGMLFIIQRNSPLSTATKVLITVIIIAIVLPAGAVCRRRIHGPTNEEALRRISRSAIEADRQGPMIWKTNEPALMERTNKPSLETAPSKQ